MDRGYRFDARRESFDTWGLIELRGGIERHSGALVVAGGGWRMAVLRKNGTIPRRIRDRKGISIPAAERGGKRLFGNCYSDCIRASLTLFQVSQGID